MKLVQQMIFEEGDIVFETNDSVVRYACVFEVDGSSVSSRYISGPNAGDTFRQHVDSLTYVPPKEYAKRKIIPAFFYEFDGIEEDMEFYPMEQLIKVGCQNFSFKDGIEIASKMLMELKPYEKKLKKVKKKK